MTRQLEEYFEWLTNLEEEAERELEEARALVDETRARARLSCACRETRHTLYYPLIPRILEMARAFGLADKHVSAVTGDAL